jgi:hypothetical protein
VEPAEDHSGSPPSSPVEGGGGIKEQLVDLFWYLSDRRWPAPNLTLLKHALEQTGWQGPAIEADSWIDAVHDRVASLDWKAAERDVRPFLEPGPETEAFGRENLLKVIEARQTRR